MHCSIVTPTKSWLRIAAAVQIQTSTQEIYPRSNLEHHGPCEAHYKKKASTLSGFFSGIFRRFRRVTRRNSELAEDFG